MRPLFDWRLWTLLGVFLLPTNPALALLVATDDASNSPYSDGWQTGDNGGSGWGGAWTLGATSGDGGQNGHFVGDSTTNGSNPSGGINTSGRAWALYANSGQTSSAVRPFATPLTSVDTFTIQMDNGYIDNNGVVGFGLQNSVGENLFEFFFIGGTDAYTVNASNLSASPPGSSGSSAFNDDGMEVAFSLTGASSFTLTVDDFGNDAFDFAIAGDLLSPAGGIDVSQVRLFNFNAGGGGERNAFFNSVSITAIPEPTATLFGSLLAGALGVTVARRPAARD